jgi:FG-GAP-like repeat
LIAGDEKTGLFLYLGAGARTFAEPHALGTAPGSPYSPLPISIEMGTLDIVVGYDNAPGRLLFNQGKGKQLQFVITTWNDGEGAVYGVAIGDLDGDGWPDIAAARSDAPNGIWFSGAGVQGTVRRP